MDILHKVYTQCENASQVSSSISLSNVSLVKESHIVFLKKIIIRHVGECLNSCKQSSENFGSA